MQCSISCNSNHPYPTHKKQKAKPLHSFHNNEGETVSYRIVSVPISTTTHHQTTSSPSTGPYLHMDHTSSQPRLTHLLTQESHLKNPIHPPHPLSPISHLPSFYNFPIHTIHPTSENRGSKGARPTKRRSSHIPPLFPLPSPPFLLSLSIQHT